MRDPDQLAMTAINTGAERKAPKVITFTGRDGEDVIEGRVSIRSTTLEVPGALDYQGVDRDVVAAINGAAGRKLREILDIQ